MASELGAALPLSSQPGRTRKLRIRLGEMISRGKVHPGDHLHFKDAPEATCEVVDGANAKAKGQTLSYLEWAKQQSGWQSVNIYEWLVHVPTGQLLEKLRRDLEQELAQETVSE